MGRSPKKSRSTAGGPNSSRRSGAARPVDPRVAKAQAAWDHGDFDRAIRLYEQALERAPTQAALLSDLAKAYALRYRYGEAETLLQRACNLHGTDAELHRRLGRTFVQLQQFDRAIDCFQRSLSLDPQGPQRARSLYELAHMYERLHRLADARAAAEEALALAPQQHVLRYLLAVIDRRAGQTDAAESQLRDLVAAGEATTETLANCWYQLAAIEDQRGEYAAAYDAACAAKKLLDAEASPYRYDAADVVRTAGRTLATTTSDHFARWGAAAPPDRLGGSELALLASHPRSGTTLLEQVLDAHPGAISADEIQTMADLVYLPLVKPHPDDTPVPQILDAAPREQIRRLRVDYFRAMEGALRQPIGTRILIDKNPALTGLLPTIARVFPEMRIVFALRDPRDVVVSCFLQQLPLNLVSFHYLTLAGTVQQYAATMRGWLKFRPWIKNPVLEVRYEDVVAELPSEARRVLEFLGLPWDESVLDYRRRAQQKHVHSPTYEAVTKPLYASSIGRWRNYAPQLEPLLPALQPYVEAFGYE